MSIEKTDVSRLAGVEQPGQQCGHDRESRPASPTELRRQLGLDLIEAARGSSSDDSNISAFRQRR